MWREDLLAAACISGLFLLLLLVAEAWVRFGNPKPEWTRKLVHLGGGPVCLSFPFVLQSPITVFVLAILMSGIFALGHRLDVFKSLHSVKRVTRGSEYYPLAVFFVFVLTMGQPWIYISSILVLAVADAFAALIGSRYGRIRYEVQENEKSLEGSLAFLALAFLAIYVPAALLTDLPHSACFLSALLVALLMTGFEAISLRGTDNLFVPIATAVILDKITAKSVAEMMYQNLSLILLSIVLIVLFRRTRTFNTGGAITFILFTYGAWSLGSEQWAIPVLCSFVVYALYACCVPCPEGEPQDTKVREVAYPAILPFLTLIVANLWQAWNVLYGPYMAGCVMVTALTLRNRLCGNRERYLHWFVVSLAACIAATTWPAWLQSVSWTTVSSVFVVAVPLTLVYDGLSSTAGRRDRRWSAVQFTLTAAAMATILLLQWLQVVAQWDPESMTRPGV